MKGKKEEANTRVWTKPWLLRRREFGHYGNLLKEIALEDVQSCINYLRMRMFDKVVTRITPRIERDTFRRKALKPDMCLAITLRYLATEGSY